MALAQEDVRNKGGRSKPSLVFSRDCDCADCAAPGGRLGPRGRWEVQPRRPPRSTTGESGSSAPRAERLCPRHFRFCPLVPSVWVTRELSSLSLSPVTPEGERWVLRAARPPCREEQNELHELHAQGVFVLRSTSGLRVLISLPSRCGQPGLPSDGAAFLCAGTRWRHAAGS